MGTTVMWAQLEQAFLQAGCPSCRPINSVKALYSVQCKICGAHHRNTSDALTALER